MKTTREGMAAPRSKAKEDADGQANEAEGKGQATVTKKHKNYRPASGLFWVGMERRCPWFPVKGVGGNWKYSVDIFSKC